MEELGRGKEREVVSVEADIEINLLASFPLLFSLHPCKAHVVCPLTKMTLLMPTIHLAK